MTQTTRAVLFVIWLLVVTLACLDSAYSSPSFFGSLILPIAWLPLMPRGQFTKRVPARDMWVGLTTVAVLFALIAWSVLSGFNRSSNEWFEEHAAVRELFALFIWLLALVTGWRAFRSGRFLASGT